MLLWFGDLADGLPESLSGWFDAVESAEIIFNQYFATLNTRRSYAETRFLMTAQAAEAYQRDRLEHGDLRATRIDGWCAVS